MRRSERWSKSLGEASEAKCASVNGIVASVSPMKKGKRAAFSEVKITDGDVHMRVVGFQGAQQQKLATFQEKSGSVSLQNCQIKHARLLDKLEIILGQSLHVQASPKKFVVGDLARIGSSNMRLNELSIRNTFNKVSVAAKVIGVEKPVKVSGGITKQEVTIADVSSAARLTMWEGDVGSMVDGKSYRLSNVVVRSYQKSKYLSLPKEGAQIDDGGDVAADDLPENGMTVFDAEVIGCTLDSYSASLGCKSKVKIMEDELGCCTKCGMEQRIDRCKKHL